MHAHGTPFSPSSCCHRQGCCCRAIQRLPVCLGSAEQRCGADHAAPAGNEKHGCQQLLRKNEHAYMWRKARHQWFCQGHQKSFRTHRPCHPQKAFLWTPFLSPLLSRTALLEGWDSLGGCNPRCSGLSWGSARQVSSEGREVMEPHWPSLEKIPLHFKIKTRYVSSHTDTNRPAALLLCCAPVPFSVSALPEPMCCSVHLWCELEDTTAWMTASSESSTRPPVHTFPMLRQPRQAKGHNQRLPPKPLCHKALDVYSHLVLHPSGEGGECVPFSQGQLDSQDMGVHQSDPELCLGKVLPTFPWIISGARSPIGLVVQWSRTSRDGNTRQVMAAAAGRQDRHRELTVPLCCSFFPRISP